MFCAICLNVNQTIIHIIVANVSGLAVDSVARLLYYISDRASLYVTDVDGRNGSLRVANHVVNIVIDECKRYHHVIIIIIIIIIII